MMPLCRKIIFFQVILSYCNHKLKENIKIKIKIILNRMKNLIFKKENLILQIIINKFIDIILKFYKEMNNILV